MIIALSFVSLMILIGLLLRSKVKNLKKLLIPTSVIAGIIGFIILNINSFNIESNTLSNIVNVLFTLSFISIGLTSTQKNKDTKKEITKGSIGMGIIWCILYAITPFLSCLLLLFLNKNDAIYALLVQFGFDQGPGQAASFGALFEQYGYNDSIMIATTFAAIGFIVAFLGGSIIIRKGIKSGLVDKKIINEDILNGYYKKDSKKDTIGYETTYSGNLETLTFNFSVMGICYLIALFISKIFSYLPSFLGTTMSSMMFMNGLFAAYIVKFVMKKLNIDYLIDNKLQSKITGLLTDYVVATSFMSIRISIISKYLLLILFVSIITAIITYITCLYFGRRIGGKNDFERTLGIFGTCTGTVSSGIALVRIVDPNLSSTTPTELGMMNLVMMLSTPVYILILACVSKAINIYLLLIILFVLIIIYILLLKVFKCFNKPTYNWEEK